MRYNITKMLFGHIDYVVLNLNLILFQETCNIN
jgi:hypothetical protein